MRLVRSATIGGVFHIPHDMLMAILPYSIEYNAKMALERYVDIAKAVGIEAKTNSEALEKLVEAI